MNFTKLIQAAAVTALLAAGSAHADSNMVVNGSFEATTQADGTWGTYNNISGWSSNLPALGFNGIEIRNNVVGQAYAGSNFVELDTDKNSMMSQVIKTTTGKNYTLSFEIQDRAGVPLSSQGIEVFWGLQNLGTFSNASSWTKETINVVGGGVFGYQALTFKAVGTSDGLGTSLDDVRLTAAVPEPETYAMMLAGLGMVGFMARRKAAKKSA